MLFSFFQNFDFSGCWWGKRAKMAQDDKKLFFTLNISGNMQHMILIYGTHV